MMAAAILGMAIFAIVDSGAGRNKAYADEDFLIQFACPHGTVEWDATDVSELALVQVGDEIGLAYKLTEEAASQFEELTQRSIGLECDLYGNRILISSMIVRTRISGRTGTIVMERTRAQELVDSYTASLTND